MQTGRAGSGRGRHLRTASIAASDDLHRPFKKKTCHVGQITFLYSSSQQSSLRRETGCGLFHLEFSNRTAARIHGARISPCRCIDARGALSSRRPSLVVHASCLICRHARTCRCGARWKSAAARGPARDKVRAPNDRARCRSCRIFYSVTFTKPDHGERLFHHGQVKIPHRNSLAGAKPPARRSVC